MEEHVELLHMNTFQIYHHPTLGDEAIKVGFSWPAFFLGPVWMLRKRLWGLAVLWFLIYVILSVIEASTVAVSNRTEGIMFSVMMVGLYTALWLVPGIKGNAWRATNLTRRGYRISNEVQANTAEDALRTTQSPSP
ncbi:MAG TPA: DUF2628 domain-containing protein [Nitrospirales bacterium]|jgi:hypothetical protein